VRRRIDSVAARLKALLVRFRAGEAGELSVAAEWFVDNHYLLVGALALVRGDLDRTFVRKLPALREDDRPATMRISVLASFLVQAGSGRVDPERAAVFLDAYQSVSPLSIAELWAFPAVLRLVLLEELATCGTLSLGGSGEDDAAAGAPSGPCLGAKDKGRLDERIAGSIGSLRTAAAVDWKHFVESVSRVDRTLRRLDPAGAYGRMDFETRDRYRKAVEVLADQSGESESQVAIRSIELAQAARRSAVAERGTGPTGVESGGPEDHVGYYLLDAGRPTLERCLGVSAAWTRRTVRWIRPRALSLYLWALTLASGLAWLVIAAPIVVRGGGHWTLPGLVLCAIVPATTLATAVINWLVGQFLQPRLVAKMDFSGGMPESAGAAVVVPCLLADPLEVRSILRQVELNYGGNQDPRLVFVILSDHVDAAERDVSGDDSLLDLLVAGAEGLNIRYGTDGRGPFVVLHRARRWNESEGRWMGWERKRGKLSEFNDLVLGRGAGSFICPVGDVDRLVGLPYVITLDADTFLPQGAARRLVGVLAHPLNVPHFCTRGTLERGYTVLQPRLETLPDGGSPTLFSRVYQADRGLDLYSHAVSDTYQDLFRTGIFAGKGIYHVEAFERTLAGRVPENALLSHDLFEGAHGRAGMVTDTALFEDFPSSVLSYMRRHHRWVRGDWQIAPWLLRIVPGSEGRRLRNGIHALGRWQIADNLRRSLLSSSLVALLLLSWLSTSRWWWWGSCAVLIVLSAPVLLGAATDAARARFTRGGATLTRSGMLSVLRVCLGVAFLPYRAAIELDAIIRTLYRLTVSKKHLLEWTSASATSRALHGRRGVETFLRGLAPGPVLAVAVAPLLWLGAPGRMPLVGIALSVWLASPLVAYWISLPRPRYRAPPRADVLEGHRELARRTWAYFERFLAPEHGWLPLDNFQEEPGEKAAARTSPTNIGLGLLSTLAAYDFGYLTSSDLLATLSNMLDSVDRLALHRGHLLNWYDTRTLEPLVPRYVSTVDSGNLAGCLIALRSGLGDLVDEEFPRPQWSRGLADTLRAVGGTIERIPESFHEVTSGVEAVVSETLRRIDAPPYDPRAAAEATREMVARVEEELARLVGQARGYPADGIRNVQEWLHRADAQARSVLAEMEELTPGPTGDDGHAERVLPPRVSLAEIAKGGGDVGRRQRAHAAASRIEQIRSLQSRCASLVEAMDFRFLYDPGRKLFHVGYNVAAGQLDGSYYDLLASEARLASYIAIAKGDVPAGHWLHLGRPFGRGEGGAVLLSWAGTMFEYLMPRLLMRTPEHSLLGVSCRGAVERQVSFARRHGVPWGISESGYHELDDHGSYQYRAFGVPSLGLRRDPGDRLVVAPYATVLAWGVAPREVARNLDAVRRLGAGGPYGMYEAIDFGTVARGAGRGGGRVVRSYMAHHQGMILIALDNLAHADVMVDRFHADAMTAAPEFLLYERAPGHVRTEPLSPPPSPHSRPVAGPPAVESWPIVTDGEMPQATALSNGRLSAIVTATGAGGLRWQDRVITRWHSDLTDDQWGHWLYIQDVASGLVWSPLEAIDRAGADCDVVFAPDRAEYSATKGDLSVRLAVTIAAGADVEVRKVTLLNQGPRTSRVQVTNYAEISLGSPTEDARHPAFVKLFVESAFHPDVETLVFRRRPSSPDDPPLFVAHTVSRLHGGGSIVAWETDRERFLGRNGDIALPAALRLRQNAGAGASGCVLDPIQSLTLDFEIPAGGEVEFAYLTAVGDSASAALSAMDAYRTSGGVAWAFQRANARSQRLLAELRIPPASVRAYQRLLSALLHPYHELRGSPSRFPERIPQQQGLWALGVTGDLPILAVKVSSLDDTPLLLDALRAYVLWREQKVPIELVVIDRSHDGYHQPIADWLRHTLKRLGRESDLNRPRGVHHLAAERLSPLHRATVEEAARVVLDSEFGTLDAHLAKLVDGRLDPPPFVPVPTGAWRREPTRPLPPPEPLLLHNGLGGFSPDGREYRMRLGPGVYTPAPWINVIATPQLGFTVSEVGSGFTWMGNSGESRLTTWSNDPVLDRSGEAVYVRDEETAEYWSPTPRPRAGEGGYEIRHGAGYTEFHHHGHGVRHRLRMHAGLDPSVKVVELELENHWSRARRLTVTYFAEWVLGANRQASAPHVETDFDGENEILLARDLFNELEEAGVAFLASDLPVHGWTTDRREFLGVGRGLSAPAGMERIGLDMRAGLGVEPCAALQVHVSLGPGETVPVKFFLGWAESAAASREIVGQCRAPGAGERSRAGVDALWDRVLSRVTVRTPDPSMEVMLNRWLPYQALACRLWGRSALYQSSGAFGFRDQLQDALAFRFLEPAITRGQILDAAGRQFAAGDVLHWWHPPSGRGVRTRCSDDLLWLPFVTAEYVRATGDEAVLDERIPYLEALPLGDGERERYASYPQGAGRSSLYEHGLRALDRASTRGRNGLPLIGAGDWNDALDRVGEGGKGESVWLGWFLLATLERFSEMATLRQDDETASRLRSQAVELRKRIEGFAWDGAWYVRATYDDGTRIGSSDSMECRIDAISQAWSVLSGGASPERAAEAMESVWRELVNEKDGLIRLLAPSFDQTPRWPGYIKAYPPGVRENGGQYTHAAVWTAWAYAALGDGDRAGRCFELLNPVEKSRDWAGMQRYRVEPYVVAADVYAETPHVGRGGWTWYTGSAAWLWRFGVEAILGLHPVAGGLSFDPCIPSHWPGYEAVVRVGAGEYRISVENPGGVTRGIARLEVDGVRIDGNRISLANDGRVHEVSAVLGSQREDGP
jgi:cyclic beta-1,2-glucan synthetase